MSEGQNKPYPLRLEPELKQWIKGKAKAADRSFNAEVNRTLRQVKESEENEEQKDKDA
jgi:hypothetical protein